MFNRLICLSFLSVLLFTSTVEAKQKVQVSMTPYAGYRQDQIRWKTSTSDSQKWKNLRGIEYGAKTEITLKDRYIIDVDLGFANLFNGNMTDTNYLKPAPGDSSKMKGSGFIFEPNLAFGFNTKPSKKVDLIPLIGMSYDLIKLSGNKSSSNPLTSLSNTLNFYGPYVGVKTKMKLGKFIIDGGASFKLAFYNGKGNWKFSGDTNNSTMKQNGRGYGIKGNLGVKYCVVKSVTLGAEAAAEWNKITNGNDTRNFSGIAGSTKSKLKNLNWTTLSGRVVVEKSF